MVRLHVGPSCYKDLNVAEIFIEAKYARGQHVATGLGSERRLPVSKTHRPADTHHAGLSGVMRPAPGGTATPGLWPSVSNLAGVEGFEPANAGIKIRCLNQLGDTPTQDSCRYRQQTYKLSIYGRLKAHFKERLFYQPARGCASKLLHVRTFQSSGKPERPVKSVPRGSCANTALPEPVMRP
jgi:hypothetical protein